AGRGALHLGSGCRAVHERLHGLSIPGPLFIQPAFPCAPRVASNRRAIPVDEAFRPRPETTRSPVDCRGGAAVQPARHATSPPTESSRPAFGAPTALAPTCRRARNCTSLPTDGAERSSSQAVE